MTLIVHLLFQLIVGTVVDIVHQMVQLHNLLVYLGIVTKYT